MNWAEFWQRVDLDEVYVLLALGIDSVSEWRGTPEQALEQINRFYESAYPLPDSWAKLLKTASKIGWTEAQVITFLKPRFEGKEREFGKWWLAIRQEYVKGGAIFNN